MLGVLLGVGLTSFVNWKLKSKEAHLRILEKIFDKRLQAHEEVLEISRLLRTTVSTKSADEGDNVITYPVIISSREEFDQFIRRFYELVNYNTHWLDIEVFRELNFIQDYIANVDILLKESNDDSFKEVALIIKSDIIDLAASLEEITMTFFDKDIYAIKIKTKKQHHKYKRTQTIKRLHSTELFKNWSEIEEKAEHNRADGRRS
ncbi:hypothetical protein SAMN05192553_102728 [Cyclobacterium xiamenense]|uniref:Uncharacterized protein n=2 Tax=Cyclobacterium xiamenense TaxID=1297121 RepID=A0A1H6WWM0_9BACT|nr:hypothetical protein SAMN05192553_102728 [Cyclobacterium xiamenense]